MRVIFVLIYSCFIFSFGFMMNSVSNHFFNFFVDMLLRPLKTNLKYEKKKLLSSRTYSLQYLLSFFSIPHSLHLSLSVALYFSHTISSLSLSHTLSLSLCPSLYLSLSFSFSLCMTARKIFIRNRKAMVLGASGNAPSLSR